MNKKVYQVFAGVMTLLLPVIGMSQAPSLTNVKCNPNGTLSDGTDDYIQFSIQPTPPVATYEAPYTYSVSATQGGSPVTVTKQDGSPADNLLYYSDYAAPLRLANGTSGNGNVIITVTPNWGSYPASTATLTDPGSCAAAITCSPSSKTVTYTYEAYRDITDADWSAYIPKFDPTGGRILTGVSVDLESQTWSRSIFENMSPGPTDISSSGTTQYAYILNGNSIYTAPIQTIQQTPGTISLGAGVLVPATGAWTGDVASGSNLSTINGMNAYSNWLRGAILLGQDPKADSRWVTNLTGDPTDDGDIYLSALHSNTYTNNLSYTSASPELANFTGTATVPLSYTTDNNVRMEGGGNMLWSVRTTTAFKVSVTYTYTENCPMPVTLISFDAAESNGKSKLQWTTSFEKNFKGSAIQRSPDLTNWTEVGFVAAISDGGTQNGRTNYAFTDELPLKGTNYYRLKQVDLDGTYKYSVAKAVKFAETKVHIYPNPASDYLVIEGLSGTEQIGIYDTKGTLVRNIDCTPEETKTVLSGLIENLYFVRITNADGTVISHKLIVTK